MTRTSLTDTQLVILSAAAQREDLRVNLPERLRGSAAKAFLSTLLAKALVEAGDASSAKLQLTWLAEHGKDEMRDMGRLRLATLLFDEKQYDEALKVLDGNIISGFEARFADTRGDILAALGKKNEAAAAYRAALKNLDEAEGSEQRSGQSSAVYHEILRQKLDSLGVEGVA